MLNPKDFPKGLSSAIGFSFDLGQITDPEYGNATNLRGQFLFPVTPGTYKVPRIVEHPEELEKQLIELLPRCRDALPDLLDEEIIAMLRDFMYSLHFVTSEELSPEVCEMLTLFCVIGFVADDIFDNDSKGVITYKTFMESIKEFHSNICSNGPNAVWDLFPTGIHSTLDAMRNLGIYTNSIAERIYPDYGEFLAVGPFFESGINTLQATMAVNELKAEEREYSQTTLFDMWRYMNANRMTLESFFRDSKAKISQSIRSDILFKCILNNFSDILMYFNAIFGLPRDIKKKQMDSPIMYFVIKKKMNLQQAFHCAYELLLDACSDYKINTTKLAEVYADDPNISKAIECMHYYITGTLIGYKIATRYGIQDKLTTMYKD